MQSNNQRNFDPLPMDVMKNLDDAKVTVFEHEKIADILRSCPRPTLYVGEVIEIKGMYFTVTRIKADGKVGLKMMPKPAPSESGDK